MIASSPPIAPGARRFESWEAYVGGRIGLGVAVDYALAWGLPAITERVGCLAATLRRMLAERPGVSVHEVGLRRSGIVTFGVAGVAAEEVQRVVAARGVNTAVSRVEYRRFDSALRGVPDLVRASVHYYNTEDELQRLCDALPSPRTG